MSNHPAIAAVLATLLVATIPGTPTSSSSRRAVPPPATRSLLEGRYVIAAAGDIACPSDGHGDDAPRTCQHDDTSDLVVGTGLDEVLTLGDNQYDVGAYRDFVDHFDPTWGRALPDISPVPGNHEYDHDPAARPGGYFRYFGDRVKGPDRLGYYSYDVGACPDRPCWHVVALNSMLCFAPGGCGPAANVEDPGPGNRMYRWLARDLRDHPDERYPCTLAYWHHPRFSFATESGGTATVAPLWTLLYDAGADVVLNGHSHNYQRWRPRDPAGDVDRERGIRQFVVGTGGASLYGFPGGDAPANLVVAQADSFGVLRMSLRAERYRWAWATAAGQPPFEDAPNHAVRCVRTAP